LKKTVFITGCNGTLGVKLVQHFLKKKFFVIGTSRKVQTKIKKSKNFLNYKLNLEKNSNLLNIINDLKKKKIKIDILINNAATPAGSLVEMTSIQNLKKVFEINFFSQIRLVQNLLRFLKKSKNASIINIGSISALEPEKGFLAYGASKSALIYATRVMAIEFKRYNIRVNALAPSVFKSKMAKKMDLRIMEKLIKKSKNNKLLDVNTIVRYVDFINSNKSKNLNGKILKIKKNNS
tara:strand:+ start:356 stop:1063 length:708 start_codon:yes stop_codon:yes gene_type:complete